MTFEPERYELLAGPTYRFELDRREFFRALGGGIVIISLLRPADAQESGGALARGQRVPEEIGAWLHINDKGAVTVYTGKVEVGQNARTSLTQAVAEELDAPLSAVELVMGDTDRTPFDIGTIGSRTTPVMMPQLRKAAAAARQLLPAGPWESINFAKVTDNETIFKALAGTPSTKPVSEWKVMGKPTGKILGRDFVTGRHRYTSDIKLPGMLYGRVLRPERLNASLDSLDASSVQKAGGITVVRDGNFAGIAAPTPAAAANALAALKAEWKSTPQTSAKTLFADLKKTAPAGPGNARASTEEAGAVETALAEAYRKLEASYTVAYIAHAPLEPRAAVAEWNGDKLTVWTGSQRPFGVRAELAQAFGIPEEKVRVIVPDTGSGYGGKHTGEAAVEAARLAKSAARPVKLVWTREEEFTWAYFRPAAAIDVRSGIDRDGRLTAWEFHNYNSGTAAIGTMYEVPNKKIEFHPVNSPLRQGSYRGLAATANHFARESHMDELALLAGIEPLEFRLKNIKDDRLRAVFVAAAERFRWGKRKAGAGVGFGIAGGFDKGGYVAACAEVQTERGRTPRVIRVTQAFECGAVVNPDHLRLQTEGAVVMGIGGPLFEGVDFADGVILNGRFSRYRVPRFRDLPEIDIVLLDRKDLPSAGAGETGIVAVAPAIANAIYAATGERIRSMPLASGSQAADQLKNSAGNL